MTDQDDTNRNRLFETKEGLKSVPAAQQGIPLQDYFKNEKLPSALKRFEAYVTDVGPVVRPRDPIPWSDLHDQKVDEIVTQAKASIEENGYYMKSALRQARILAEGTDRPKDGVFKSVLDRFAAQYGKEPGEMVKDWRRARNLPVDDMKQQPSQEPEL